MKTLATIFQLKPEELKAIAAFLPSKEPVLSGKNRIPVCEPDIGKKEGEYVSRAVASSWLSSAGSFVSRFEQAFAGNVSHTRFAFAVNSGTTALHLALASLGIGPGDEVILPGFTMIATANAVLYCGAKPVFVDADPASWNIDVRAIEKKITAKTKAIIVVHTYGLPVDMDPVIRLAKSRNLWIVEDAAEAHGALYKGRPVGSIGDVAAFSLYANKLITTGEGGVVTTDNPEIAKRVELLHNHAFSEDRHFWHTMVGYGYRMTNLQAAVGLAQVQRIDSMLRRKRAHARMYRTLLGALPGITLPQETPESVNSYWMFGILVDKARFGMDKNELRAYLARHGIETRSFFIPVHIQPPYYQLHRSSGLPQAERLCRDGLYLPSSTCLSSEAIRRICSNIARAGQVARDGHS